jgi:hypothetical protein
MNGSETPTLGFLLVSEAAKPMTTRDLMAPDTEPTDEELALVMREAREVAVARRAKADAWIAAKLKEASEFAEANSRGGRNNLPR